MALVRRNPPLVRDDRYAELDLMADAGTTKYRSARRYVDTFLRLWFIALVPVIVLPVGAFFVAHSLKGNAAITANIWVSQDSTKHLPYADPLSSPAANVATALQQLLQSLSFDVRVAHESPLYWASMEQKKDRDIAIVSDISKNMKPVAGGPDLVAITYTNKSGPAGVQLLTTILRDAPREIGKLNKQQSASTLSFYQHQLGDAQRQLDKATSALGHYARRHHISPAQMADRALFDPSFSALYQSAQSAQVAVHDAQQQLTQVTGPNSLGSSIQLIDAPSAQPPQVSKKQLGLDLGIGLIVGLMLGAVFVVSMTAVDHTLRYPDEVSRLVGVPVLVSTPYVPALERSDRGGRRSRR